MSELRSTTFQLEFDGQDGITGIKQFTRAVTDADKTVDELSKSLGDNVTVTAKNIRSKKELTQDARRLAAQIERNNSKVKEMTRLYQHNTTSIKKTADEQEVLNAVYRLGANATDMQKEKVSALVTEYQRVRDSSGQAQTGFRNLRGITQNLGWQLQDVAVQAQMGTSAFVILGQQGSQMASAFGPTGALVGAFIAIVSSLAGVTVASKNAKAAAQNLKDAEIKLIPHLREKAKALKFLEESQIRYLQTLDAAQLKKFQKDLNGINARIFSMNSNWSMNTKKAKENQLELDKLRAKQATLSDVISETEQRIASYNKNLDNKNEIEKSSLESIEDSIIAYELQAEQLGFNNRAIALSNAAKAGADEADIKRIRAAFTLIDAYEKELKVTKKLKKASNDLERAFKSEFNTVTKQTESVGEQYSRRKKAIDDYVVHVGKSTADTKTAYSNLNIWREGALDKEFDTLVKNLTRQTSTTQQEYEARKQIIDDHVKRVGSIDAEAATAYESLEKWKTTKLGEEYAKREIIRKQIEKAQQSQSGLTDKVGSENNLFTSNMMLLNAQKASIGEEELAERQRIDGLIESEVDRHNARMDELNLESMKAMVGTFSMASSQITSLVDIMSNGVGQVEEKTKEMNGVQKAAFLFSQGVAAANALIAGITLGSQLAAMFPLAAPAMLTLGTGIGVANATAITSTTFAGAFDNGGHIPGGQMGIVSEYGDELVNGQLIKGPANVTSREDTAKMMNGGGGDTNIIIENRIEGANYRTQQIDDKTVRIIAEQVLSDNIDKSVSSVLDNKNSKTNKSMRSQYNVGKRL